MFVKFHNIIYKYYIMELGILGGLAYLGSNYESVNEEKQISSNYHPVNLIYNNDNYEKNLKKIENKNNLIKNASDPIKTNIINNSIYPINNISLDYKDMNFYQENVKKLDNSIMFESFNDNLNNSNQTYDDQFKSLRFDNESKPSTINQGHKSIDINKFNSIERNLALGNEYSFFEPSQDMTYGITNDEDFKHNNMVPHFSKKQMINDYNEQNIAHRVDLFSGSSRNFIPKKEELLENFAPVQKNVNLVNGSQNTLEFQRSYYLPGREKRNILPFEQEKVGPGLNMDPIQSIRPDGGKFEEYRPLPKNVDQLRSADRPKTTYEGIVKPGQKGQRGKLIGKVYKRRPEKTREIKPEEFQKSGGEIKKQKAKDNYVLKNTSRKNSFPIIGPVKFIYDMITNKNSAKTTLSNKKESSSSGPTNLKNIISKVNQNKCSYSLAKTQRNNSLHNEHPTHPHQFNLGNVSFNIHDLPKQTLKQTTLYNKQLGTANGPNSNKIYNPKDIARKTIRQTTDFNKSNGVIDGPEKVKSYNPDDLLRKTTKQTTIFNKEHGYANGPNTNTTFNPNDLTRKTIKQTTLYNNQNSNFDGPNANISFNPSDLPKKTIKQTTTFNEQNGYVDGPEKVISYNPNDLPKITRKENLTFNEQAGYVDGPNTNISFNPSDLIRNTLREGLTFTEHSAAIKNDINKSQTYDPDDILKTTLREEIVNNKYIGHAKDKIDAPNTYDPNDILRTTLREENSGAKRMGQLKGETIKQKVFDPTDIPANTLKDLLVTQYELGVAQGIINKNKSFNPNDVPAQTLKEMCVINKHLTNANQKDFNQGYISNKYQVPETLRQLINILIFGNPKGNDAPKNYSAEKNTELDDRKEISIQNREPTNRKHNVIPTSNTNLGDVDLKDTVNILRNPIMNRTNYFSNNFNLPAVYNSKNYRQEESNRLNPEILNQLNNNPLVNNVVISQPQKKINEC